MDESADGVGDSFGKSFFTKDEAIAEAKLLWRNLSACEKQGRHVFVGYIDAESIPDNVLGERDIVGDIDPDNWSAEDDDNWFLNFSSGYEVLHECADEK